MRRLLLAVIALLGLGVFSAARAQTDCELTRSNLDIVVQKCGPAPDATCRERISRMQSMERQFCGDTSAPIGPKAKQSEPTDAIPAASPTPLPSTGIRDFDMNAINADLSKCRGSAHTRQAEDRCKDIAQQRANALDEPHAGSPVPSTTPRPSISAAASQAHGGNQNICLKVDRVSASGGTVRGMVTNHCTIDLRVAFCLDDQRAHFHCRSASGKLEAGERLIRAGAKESLYYERFPGLLSIQSCASPDVPANLHFSPGSGLSMEKCYH